jgi:hypothetical protein
LCTSDAISRRAALGRLRHEARAPIWLHHFGLTVDAIRSAAADAPRTEAEREKTRRVRE